MKNVLILCRLAVNIPNLQTGITRTDINLISGTNLEEVKSAFERHNNEIDVVIMGAGIELSIRLAIIEYIFNTSKSTTVHMKDWDSGPAGMLPFVNGVLANIA